MVLYSTKSGSLARNHRGTTFGAVLHLVVLQKFFTGSLAPLPYTEPVKFLNGSSTVLHQFFGTATIYKTC